MDHPEYIYWAAVCLVAWPCALFSRCAGILALTWAIGQIAYVVGMPEPMTQVALYCIAFVTTWVSSRIVLCRAVALLYLPLAALSVLTFADPAGTWWRIFTVAMIQVTIVPFTVHWAEVREVIAAFKQRRKWDDTLFRMRRALCW